MMGKLELIVFICFVGTVTKGQDECVEGLFYCDGTCIDLPFDRICDMKDDCADGTDEKNCDFQPPQIVSIFDEPVIYFGDLPYKNPKRIRCQAVGKPEVEYLWKVNGKPFPNIEGVITTDKITGVLTLYHPRELGRAGSGQYQCYAKNAAGTALSDIIEIKHAFLGSFQVNTYNYEKTTEFQYLKLVCKDKPQSFPTPVYSWHRQAPGTEDTFPQKIDKRIAIDLEGNLHFAFVEKKDESNPELYLCSLYNSEIQSQMYGSKTEVEVEEGQSEVGEPIGRFHPSVTAKLGTTARLQCIFSGNPAPDVQWYDTSSRRVWPDGKKYELTDFNRILKIFDVEEIDEGQYECVGKNLVGETDKIPVVLNVVGSPIWEDGEKPTPQVSPVGSDVTFSCKARNLYGDGELGEPKWYRNGEPFPSGMWNKFVFNDDKTELTVKDVQKPHDITCIYCKYENDVGTTAADFSLVVINPIEIVGWSSSNSEGTEEIEGPVGWDGTDGTEGNERRFKILPGEFRNFSILAEIDEENIELRYTWVLRNETIVESDAYTFSDDGKSLTVDTRSLNDEEFGDVLGMYTVKIWHKHEEKFYRVELYTEPAIAPVAAAGGDLWWILLIILIVLLLLLIILIVCCCCFRNRGGTWPVDEKDRAAGHNPEKELENSGFHDLGRMDDDDDDYYYKKPLPDNDSLPSDRMFPNNEEDSLLEYSGEVDTSRFNEEGSFIGAYGKKKGGRPAPPPPPAHSRV